SDKEVKRRLKDVMGQTYSDGSGLSRYGIPQPSDISTQTFSQQTFDSGSGRVFGKAQVDLRNPAALPEGQVDLPRSANPSFGQQTYQEQAFPTPSLVREEVYQPPSFIPETQLEGQDANVMAAQVADRINENLNRNQRPLPGPASPPRAAPALAPQSAGLYNFT